MRYPLSRVLARTLGLSLLLAAGAIRLTGTQDAHHLKATVKVNIDLDYLLFLPDGYEQAPDRKWPVIIFLHGSGERGNDPAIVARHGPPKIVGTKPDFPFIVVSPQCRLAESWYPDEVAALTKYVLKHYRADPDRVYITGLSMGGYGTWTTAVKHPDLFAAIAPICGGGDPSNVASIKDLPVWAFHGVKDDSVPLSSSEQMVAALERVGGKVRHTWYEDTDHVGAWTKAYADDELYRWFLSHKRSERAALTGK